MRKHPQRFDVFLSRTFLFDVFPSRRFPFDIILFLFSFGVFPFRRFPPTPRHRRSLFRATFEGDLALNLQVLRQIGSAVRTPYFQIRRKDLEEARRISEKNPCARSHDYSGAIPMRM